MCPATYYSSDGTSIVIANCSCSLSVSNDAVDIHTVFSTVPLLANIDRKNSLYANVCLEKRVLCMFKVLSEISIYMANQEINISAQL